MGTPDVSQVIVGHGSSLASEKYQSYDFKNGGYLIKNFMEALEELEKDVEFSQFRENQ